jgi:hypothetical protein
MVLLDRARRRRLLVVGISLALGALVVPPAGAQAATLMTGKGTANESTGKGGTVTYAYVIPCNAPGGSNPPFELRVSGGPLNGSRFRLAKVANVVSCFDDPGVVPRPAAGFDTQIGQGGLAAGLGGGPFVDWFIAWRFLDGGPGGLADGVDITIGRVIPDADPDDFFRFFPGPPGKFPGSDQASGFNTALVR